MHILHSCFHRKKSGFRHDDGRNLGDAALKTLLSFFHRDFLPQLQVLHQFIRYGKNDLLRTVSDDGKKLCSLRHKGALQKTTVL